MSDAITKNWELNVKEKKQSTENLKSTPIRISMNLTGNCNIRCTYCHLSFAKYYTKKEMDLDKFRKLEPFLKQAKHLVYFSSTEPLFAKNFKEIFTYTDEFTAEKYFSTNAILLNETTSQMIVDSKLDFLTISVAGITNETFEKYHKVKKLQTVINNIKKLNEIKEKNNTIFPRLRLVFVLTYENKNELNDAIRLAKELKFSEGVKITYLKAYSDDLIDITPFNHREEINEFVRSAQDLANELDIKVEFDGDNFDDLDFKEETSFHKPCYEPFERLHVEADGKVRPCVSFSCDEFAGDISTQSVEEIWNSEVYKKFRSRVNTDNPPDSCKRCTHNFHKDFKRADIWDLSDMNLAIYNRKKAK